MFACMIEVAELDAAGALAVAGELRARRDQSERDLLVLGAHYADLYEAAGEGAGQLRPGARARGGERTVPLGPGGPAVWEFAVAELAAELELTTWSARRMMADSVGVRDRLPRVWQRLLAGEALAGRARRVAQATVGLSPQAAAEVDAGIVEVTDGRVTFSRFLGILAGLVVAADPDAAAEAERRAAAERFTKVGQCNDHGHKTLYVKTSAAEMTRIEATIGHLATLLARMGDTDAEDLRRTKAVLLLANPVQALALMQAYQTARARGTVPDDDHDTRPEPPEPPEPPEESRPPEPAGPSGAAGSSVPPGDDEHSEGCERGRGDPGTGPPDVPPPRPRGESTPLTHDTGAEPPDPSALDRDTGSPGDTAGLGRFFERFRPR
jgi:hypothetical protein